MTPLSYTDLDKHRLYVRLGRYGLPVRTWGHWRDNVLARIGIEETLKAVELWAAKNPQTETKDDINI